MTGPKGNKGPFLKYRSLHIQVSTGQSGKPQRMHERSKNFTTDIRKPKTKGFS